MTDLKQDRNNQELESEDIERMIALLSETCRHASRNTQIRVLMDGIADLVHAKAWVWGASVRLTAEAIPTWILHQHGGFTDEEFAKFVKAQEHPDMQRLTAPFVLLLEKTAGQLTRTRDQTDPEGTFRTSPSKPLWDEAGVAPGIMSCRILGSDGISVAGFFRGSESPPYSEKERLIAHILLTEVSWLHLPDPEEIMVPVRKLSPRKITVCNLLLQGQGRREIASYLDLRENTVHSYTKEVFRHFRVHSQAELVAKFRIGAGED